MLLLSGMIGLVVLAAQGLVFAYYCYFTRAKFGGVTGDTAGWLVCIAEAAALCAIWLARQI